MHFWLSSTQAVYLRKQMQKESLQGQQQNFICLVFQGYFFFNQFIILEKDQANFLKVDEKLQNTLAISLKCSKGKPS